MKKTLKICIILLLICSKCFSKENFFIIYNVGNKIITNIDVEKESSYLISFNDQLANLGEEKNFEIAKESLLRDEVKKSEIKKFFDFEKKNQLIIDSIRKQYYLKIGLKNALEFQNYLNEQGLTIEYVNEKIQVELLWNKLIYEKYKDQIKINTSKIKKEIAASQKNIDQKIYLISEILFETSNKKSLVETTRAIKQSIKEIGFKNTANIYSIADSKKFGGDVGWIEEKNFSKKIFSKLINLNIGEYTAPLQAGNLFLILKIEDIKYEKKKIDQKKELEQKIEFESNRQLTQYSKIYYNKVKINIIINEL